MKITHVIVMVRTDDGEMRAVVLEGKQPKQVEGFITHLHGGRIKLTRQPIAIPQEAKPKLEAVES